MTRLDRIVTLPALCLFNLLFLWIWTSALRKEAEYLIPIGLIVVTVSLVFAFRGRPRSLFTWTLASALLAVTVLGLEATLWIAPGLLRGNIANAAYHRYNIGPRGMYRPDRNTGRRLKPDFHCQAYWAGHWWQHDTNCDGYRGPRAEAPVAVFLGDSMVYGHGVDNDQTVAAHFQRITGLPSANLGQQATCILHALSIFESTGVSMQPQFVFLCTHPNDAPEALLCYPQHVVQELTDAPINASVELVALERPHPPQWWRLDRLWHDHARMPLRCEGAIRWLLKYGRSELTLATERAYSYDPATGPPIPLHYPFPQQQEDQIGWHANIAALARLRDRCLNMGAELILYDIAMPTAFTNEVESVAQKLRVRYSPAGRVALQRNQLGEKIYLENDGHWTARGNEVIAQQLARELDASSRPTNHSRTAARDGDPER